jgi:hypothetical protein
MTHQAIHPSFEIMSSTHQPTLGNEFSSRSDESLEARKGNDSNKLKAGKSAVSVQAGQWDCSLGDS